MYDSILNVFKRDQATNLIVLGNYSHPDFRTLRDVEWEATEKYDGTNIRLTVDNGVFSVGGRTESAQIPTPLFAHCDGLRDSVIDMFKQNSDVVTLYGEGVGPKIQKGGGRYGDSQHFVLFDVQIGKWWLERHAVADVANELGIPHVTVQQTDTLRNLVYRMLLGPVLSSVDGEPCEGWVARPVGGLLHRNGKPIRVKIKERDFGPLRGLDFVPGTW